jgi:prolyl-tRNA synthetase
MRWSQAYVLTLRQDPADAEAASHRLLVRAGFVRQLMAGHYMLLPLAVRVRAKIIGVIREEMDRIGAQEFILPAMHPAELWQRSGRWEAMGDELFRVRDRKGADIALGMTHEEVFTTLALELRSYRDLPRRWYQFQTKFRDEPRPKGGLLRVREFTMKDSYSFDLDAAGLDRSFDLHHQAYARSFERLGIPAIPVQASSGSMGGSASVEFMCPSEAGEDLVVRCPACGYAANVEKATVTAVADGPGPPAPEPFPTPGAATIRRAHPDEVREAMGVDVDRDLRVDRWADLREVAAGEPCPVCGRPLEVLRAIEVGHIFKLGYRYAEALGLSVLGPDGGAVRPIMGSYGIGIERAMAAIVECHHDDAGIVWPVAVAPFAVAVAALDPGDPEVMRVADAIADRLAAAGTDVLVDDRDERPGVKFRDVELIGFPFRVTVGARDLAEGTVEVTRRDTGERQAVAVDGVAGRLLDLLGSAPA